MRSLPVLAMLAVPLAALAQGAPAPTASPRGPEPFTPAPVPSVQPPSPQTGAPSVTPEVIAPPARSETRLEGAGPTNATPFSGAPAPPLAGTSNAPATGGNTPPASPGLPR